MFTRLFFFLFHRILCGFMMGSRWSSTENLLATLQIISYNEFNFIFRVRQKCMHIPKICNFSSSPSRGEILTDIEKSHLVKLLALTKSTMEIARELKWDHRTIIIESFVNEGKVRGKNTVRADRHVIWEKSTDHYLQKHTVQVKLFMIKQGLL